MGARQLVSAEWIELSTSPITTFGPGHERGEGNGYGFMWWILPADPGAKVPEPELVPLTPSPLGAAPRPRRPFKDVPAAEIAAVVGVWLEESGSARLELFEAEGRLFARRRAQRLLEAELRLGTDGLLFAPEAPVAVEVLARDGGRATSIAVTLFGQRSLGRRE